MQRAIFIHAEYTVAGKCGIVCYHYIKMSIFSIIFNVKKAKKITQSQGHNTLDCFLKTTIPLLITPILF